MTCPICGKDGNKEHHPFCSKRCAQVDLGRWLNGSYAIPTAEMPDEAEFAQQAVDQPIRRPN